VIANHSVDPARVYVAGLSAGGAMAAVMIHTYPELYAAAGIHSGLPYRCAHDVPSALAAMKGAVGARRAQGADGHDGSTMPKRPLIVFHGDADKTVHPSNGSELVRAFSASTSPVTEPLDRPGRACTRRRLTAANGIDAEYWIIHGAPHAWAGGSVRGTYTDAAGPDASAEMMRFFLAHPRNDASRLHADAREAKTLLRRFSVHRNSSLFINRNRPTVVTLMRGGARMSDGTRRARCSI